MAKIITLTESDINRIIARVMNENRLISEQKLNADGTYTSKNPHKLISNLERSNKRFHISIPAGTKFYKKGDNVMIGDTGHKLKCSFGGYSHIFHHVEGDTLEEYNSERPLSKVLRKLFCDKSKSTVGGGGKPTPIKKIFTDDQICRLTDDKTWIYAKDEKGVWWTSKDGGKNWFELKLPKFQKAVDLLNTECPKNNVDCKTKCNAKPLQPGQTGSQVEMWFFGIAGCQKETGSGGFSSEEECEACNCTKVIGDGQISEEECFKNYPCLEVLLKDGTLYEGDSGYDMISCGCLYGSKESIYRGCIFYCDGTAWCEGTVPGKGDKYVFECNQNQIDIDRENPKERNVEKPKNPIDGGKDDGDQGFPLG